MRTMQLFRRSTCGHKIHPTPRRHAFCRRPSSSISLRQLPLRVGTSANVSSRTSTSASASSLAEAERLLEEQIRLLEKEREESLSVAQSCTDRSKRLLARLDNLKRFQTPGQSAGGSRTQPQRPPSSQRAGSGSGAPTPNTAGSGAGNPTEQEQAQARRLVSRALQRNVARGKNNLALAEKLQVYIRLLREELRLVRQGDARLAVQIVEKHRASTVTTEATEAAALAGAVPVAATAGAVPAEAAAAAPQSVAPQHPPSPSTRVPTAATDAAAANAVSGSTSPPSPSSRLAAGSEPSGTAPPGPASISTQPSRRWSAPTESHAPPLLDRANTSRHADTVSPSLTSAVAATGPATASATTPPAEVAGEPPGSGSTDPQPGSAAGPPATHGSAGDGASSSDAGTGLDQIFSRTQLTLLPGDPGDAESTSRDWGDTDTGPSSGGGENDAGGGGGSTAALAAGPGPSSSAPTLSSAVAPVDAASTSAAPGLAAKDARRGGRGGDDGAPGSADAASSSGADDAAASATMPGEGDGEGARGAAGAGAGAGTLGLTLEDARVLARDSEDARVVLMGLLRPQGALPGPLEAVQAADLTPLARDGSGAGASRGAAAAQGKEEEEERVEQQQQQQQPAAKAGDGGSGTGGRGVQDPRQNGRSYSLPGDGSAASGTRPQETGREGRYNLAGDQVPSRTLRLVPRASAAAAVAAAAAAAAAAAWDRSAPAPTPTSSPPSSTPSASRTASGASRQAQGQAGQDTRHGSGASPGGSGDDTRVLAALLAVMVRELRREGYVGCDERVEAAAREVERALTAARAATSAAGARGRSTPRS